MARSGPLLWLTLGLALLVGALPLCVCTPCSGEGTILHVAGFHVHDDHAGHGDHGAVERAPCGHHHGAGPCGGPSSPGSGEVPGHVPDGDDGGCCGGDAAFVATTPTPVASLPPALPAPGEGTFDLAGFAPQVAPRAPIAVGPSPRTRGFIVLLR